jgi:hypothetical protein
MAARAYWFNGVTPVDAIRFKGTNFEDIEAFVGGDAESREGNLLVATRNGPLTVEPGAWIVQRWGEFLMVPDSEFRTKYQRMVEGMW